MKNIAPAKYRILDCLAERWSPIAFSGRPVEPEKIARIFEAARWAASCFNDQPWSFIIATQAQTEAFSALADCLVEGNAYARKAPILALSIARTVFQHNGKPNRHGFHDLGMAVGNLLAQATEEGLMVHQMAGFDIEKARTTLGVPEHHEPVAMMAIGYYGNRDDLTPAQREREERPRSRKPVEEFLFHGKWGMR